MDDKVINTFEEFMKEDERLTKAIAAATEMSDRLAILQEINKLHSDYPEFVKQNMEKLSINRPN